MVPHSKPWITKAETLCAQELIETGHMAAGPRVQQFRRVLADVLGATEAWVCASGTQALVGALNALGLSKEDEVILPTYTCPSVYDAVVLAGATPIFCDVGNAWNMTPETVAPRITARTRAIILVHHFGLTERVEPFRKFGVSIISDLCQNFDVGLTSGVSDDGDIQVFSFHSTKCLTTAHGGAVVARNSKLAKPLAEVMRGVELMAGITDLQAALGTAQLSRYAEFQARRRTLADRYFAALPSHLCDSLAGVRDRWNFFRFPLRQRLFPFSEIASAMAEQGVLVRQGIDTLLHRNLGLSDHDFPNAVRSYQETISIPFYPALSDFEAKKVINACRVLWNNHGDKG